MTNNSIGQILELFISQEGKSQRTKRTNINLDTNGVLEDKFYGKNITRSVLITSTHSYALAKENNIDIAFSDLGENILIDYNPYQLSLGTQLKVGDTILEISQHCTLCKSLTKVHKSLPKLLKDDRGVFAKVIQYGKVNKGDKLYLLN